MQISPQKKETIIIYCDPTRCYCTMESAESVEGRRTQSSILRYHIGRLSTSFSTFVDTVFMLCGDYK
jgi:hypothetical protein